MDVIRKFKRLIYIVRKRSVLHVDSHSYKLCRYGNDYGGFMVCEEVVGYKPIVYSFGIGEDLSFSEDVERKLKAEIYAYDPTPQAIEFVKRHPLGKNGHFHFEEIGLSDKDEKAMFYIKPANSKDVSGSIIPRDNLEKDGIEVEMQSIESISKKNGHTCIDILKMDVEGSEFKVIEGLKGCKVEIKQICLEVHDRFFADGIERLRKSVCSLKEIGYQLVFVSFKGDELTFVKKI